MDYKEYADISAFNEPGIGISNFKDLICWQKCRELRKNLENLVESFPAIEKTRLSDQIIRAARSTTNNIAEGFGRYHFKDSIRFYYMTRGSISELLDHLQIAFDNGYIDKLTLQDFEAQCEESAKILNGYIKFIQSKITN